MKAHVSVGAELSGGPAEPCTHGAAQEVSVPAAFRMHHGAFCYCRLCPAAFTEHNHLSYTACFRCWSQPGSFADIEASMCQLPDRLQQLFLHTKASLFLLLFNTTSQKPNSLTSGVHDAQLAALNCAQIYFSVPRSWVSTIQ